MRDGTVLLWPRRAAIYAGGKTWEARWFKVRVTPGLVARAHEYWQTKWMLTPAELASMLTWLRVAAAAGRPATRGLDFVKEAWKATGRTLEDPRDPDTVELMG